MAADVLASYISVSSGGIDYISTSNLSMLILSAFDLLFL